VPDPATPPRPLPDVGDPLYAPHLQGLREHRILVQRCRHCGHRQWPPRELCFSCHEEAFDWVEMPAVGTIYTFSVAYRGFNPWFKDQVPYASVVADLGDGIRILAAGADDDVDSITCGDRVHAEFDDVSDELTVLRWRR